MFYAQFVLSKKGPLSKIWLAAHWERKLTKAQIFETNVQDAVDEIMKPKVKLSLRTTGHLLLGLVRIYSRKAKYVLSDLNEAFLKIKMAFRPGYDINLPLRSQEENILTLRCFQKSDLLMDLDDIPDFDPYETPKMQQYKTKQVHIGQITLPEDNCETSSVYSEVVNKDDFGMGSQHKGDQFGFEESFHDDFETARHGKYSNIAGNSFEHRGPHSLLEDDVFGRKANEDFGADDFGDMGNAMDLDNLFEQPMDLDHLEAPRKQSDLASLGREPLAHIDNTSNFSESTGIVLEPLDQVAFNQKHQEKAVVRQRRKRRLVVDEQKNISGDEMKANMADYSDIVQSLDLAPPTKRLMRLKENGTTEKLFSMPGCINAIQNPQTLKLYQSHLVLCAKDMNEYLTEEIHRDLGLVDNFDELDNLDNMQDWNPNTPFVPEPYEDNAIANQENIEPQDAEVPNGAMPTPASEKRGSGLKSCLQEGDEDEEDEHLISRRTKGILHSIVVKLKANDNKIVFEDLFTRGSTRRTAAQKFYALLELRKRQAIEVEQSEPYAPIEVMPGSRMEEALTAIASNL
ncbi:conserved region of rad21 / rec8 like protein domain-containing protein [Ditylenchus destructor]|uniref:Conserved region of rad21 / rec8 like protein domain-containing protein n=1 Tax=Ditylenchus destructor TaxID=166010 RepID=A0AAD4R6D1_9BILA|nr:conserved region of rad21 / rec8 like protein domain-containing protein [Ditylenchus destructor]